MAIAQHEPEKEKEILRDVVIICSKRIQALLRELQKQSAQENIHQLLDRAENATDFETSLVGEEAFKEWLSRLPLLLELHPASPTDVIPYIEWAAQARWRYAEHIAELLPP